MTINVEDLIEGNVYRVHGNIPSHHIGMAKIIGKYRRSGCNTMSGPCFHLDEAKLISLRAHSKETSEFKNIARWGHYIITIDNNLTILPEKHEPIKVHGMTTDEMINQKIFRGEIKARNTRKKSPSPGEKSPKGGKNRKTKSSKSKKNNRKK
jgi:hypothetical protein